MTLTKPDAANDNLSNIVDIIKPVFLINWEYRSVYLKEISSINTSTSIRIVKKSTKNRKFTLSSYPLEKKDALAQL